MSPNFHSVSFSDLLSVKVVVNLAPSLIHTGSGKLVTTTEYYFLFVVIFVVVVVVVNHPSLGQASLLVTTKEYYFLYFSSGQLSVIVEQELINDCDWDRMVALPG